MSEVKSLGQPKLASECLNGDRLTADQLGNIKWTLKIHSVENRMEPPPSGGPERRVTLMGFEMADGSVLDKRMAVNVTNTKCLIAMFGPVVDKWIGKYLTIYSEPGCYQGTDPGIRIWGSPDLDGDMTITVRLPRKKPTSRTLHKTGRKAQEQNDGV